MSQLTIVLDIVVAILLAATIAYAVVLNRKLATLRNTKQEMETLINRLIDSTAQAEKGLSELKSAAGDAGRNLEAQVNKAQGLSDDLGFMVDKANSLADRLETQITQARHSLRSNDELPAKSTAKASRARDGGIPDAQAKRSKSAADRAYAGPSKTKSASDGAQAAAGEGDTSLDDNLPPANAKLLRALRGVR